MSSIFSKIINGEIPSYKVAEDDRFYAFLDIRPLQAGHVLVVPKIEVDYIFDLDDNTLSGLILFSKRVAKAISATIPCKRIGVAVIGLEVPHCHVHLSPINSIYDLDFSKPKQISAEKMQEIAVAIQANFK
ncbi:MAG: HIT family protein [Chitinophagales bacterium]|nr:HIT family protein [Chitinophagales bacterium]MCZ2393964.1 HIT family protein [Chitinophagales bacterium]